MAQEERRTRFAGGALRIGDRRIPLRSGSVQYFRLERSVWRKALEAARAVGVGMIETYVPWSVHERAPGELDFGAVRPENDLGAFLDLAHELGLAVFLRPGPHINAELTYFGLPYRIVSDEECWARSPRDTPVYLHAPPRMFPVPSFASRRFQEEAERWLAAVADIARSRTFPNGPVVMVQLDNEPCLYFRNGAYDQDYHPDAQARFRRFLRERYASLDALRAAHGLDYGSFDHADPPARFEADPRCLARHLDWAAFQETLVAEALRRFAAVLRERGLDGIPTVVNLPVGEGGMPVDYRALAGTADLVGFDYYHRASSLDAVRRRTQLLRGLSDLPFAPELGIGSPPWILPLSDDDSFFTALAALASGLRGMNLYMLVDRDRWTGAPIDESGAARPSLVRWSRLLTALEAVVHEALTQRVEVAIVLPEEYRRLGRVTSLLGPLNPQLFDALAHDPVFGCRSDTLSFEEPVQIRWWEDVRALTGALDHASVPFDYVPGELAAERLARYRFVFCPSFELGTAERCDALARAARDGAAVAFGPREPRVDDRGRPLHLAFGPGMSLVDTTAESWADALVGRWTDAGAQRVAYASKTPGVRVDVHDDATGPRVVFVTNPGEHAVEAVLESPSPARFVDALTGEELPAGPHLVVTLHARSVRMLVVDRSHAHVSSSEAGRAGARNIAPKARPSARAGKKRAR